MKTVVAKVVWVAGGPIGTKTAEAMAVWVADAQQAWR